LVGFPDFFAPSDRDRVGKLNFETLEAIRWRASWQVGGCVSSNGHAE